MNTQVKVGYVTSQEHVDKVKELAKQQDRSESSVIRQAIDFYYENFSNKK